MTSTPTSHSYHPTALQVQALTLLTEDFHLDCVSEITTISSQTLQYIRKKVKDCDYNSEIDCQILEEYVVDEQHTD